MLEIFWINVIFFFFWCQVYSNQPGFRQSFSGSETSTDVSLSSTENLATSQRQEPQGEETQTSFNYHLDLGNTEGSSYSILERLGLPASAIDLNRKLSGSGMFSASSSVFGQEKLLQQHHAALNSTSSNLGLSSSSPLFLQKHLTIPQWHLGNSALQHQEDYADVHQNEITTCRSEYSTPSSRSEAESVYSSSSSALSVTVSGREAGQYSAYAPSLDRVGSGGGAVGTSSGSVSSSSSSSHHYLSPRVPPVSTYHHPHPYVNTHWTVGSSDAGSHTSYTGYHSSSPLTYSQSGVSSAAGGGGTVSYSGQDQTLSYLANLPPPPQYPGVNRGLSHLGKSADIRTCRSYEAVDRMDVSGLHADLRLCAGSPGISMQDVRCLNSQR